MHRKTKICGQVYYVIETMCINKHMFYTEKATTDQDWIMSPFMHFQMK